MRRPPLDDPTLPPALGGAIARGWRGLGLVAHDGGAALVRADDAGAPADEGLRIGVRGDAGGVPERLVMRLDGGAQLVLDLRLASARALAAGLGRRGELELLDLGRPADCHRRRRGICLRPAAALMRDAAARAGEWHPEDPCGGLGSYLRWRLDADASVPRLVPAQRMGGVPVLAVPAGAARAPAPTAAWVAAAIAEDAGQAALLDRAAAAGRLMIAELALGAAAALVGARTIALA